MVTPSTRPVASTPSRGATGLIVVALVLAAGIAARSGREFWSDSGPFSLALLGVPLVCAAGALVAERAGPGHRASAVVGVLAAVSLVWSLVLALAIGLLLVPSLLLVAATLVSWADRRPDQTAPVLTVTPRACGRAVPRAPR